VPPLARPTRRIVLAGLSVAAAPRLARPAAAATSERISFDGLYKSFGVLGLSFDDRVVALKGREVSMAGYMAPPLKPESTFFVLTREPLAICPFCQSDADWPVDIVVVYLRAQTALAPAGARTEVSGRLELGSWTDPDTGFVSQIRLVQAGYRS
jgi:hypothetical protein